MEDNVRSPMVLVAGRESDLPASLKADRKSDISVIMKDNADLAYKIAFDRLPDLIIIESFVTELEQMDFLSKLNSDPLFLHIPIIRYVSKREEYTYLRGLEAFGDNSFGGSFKADKLTYSTISILNKQASYRDKYKKEYPLIVGSKFSQGLNDPLFQKLFRHIQYNMHKEDFDPYLPPQDLKLSKNQIIRKIYMLTGFTPSELLLNMRLKVAILLLDCGHDDISRLMRETGFSDRKEFDSKFRDVYGTDPEEYIKK